VIVLLVLELNCCTSVKESCCCTVRSDLCFPSLGINSSRFSCIDPIGAEFKKKKKQVQPAAAQAQRTSGVGRRSPASLAHALRSPASPQRLLFFPTGPAHPVASLPAPSIAKAFARPARSPTIGQAPRSAQLAGSAAAPDHRRCLSSSALPPPSLCFLSSMRRDG
jgi:hypothetical protein